MKYKCTKCGNEFDVSFNAVCPSCGAKDWDVKPLLGFGNGK